MEPSDRISLPPGRRIGPYLLADPLAEGGMGRVQLAVRVGSAGFRRVVAIKRARPDLSSLEYQEMFASEIELMAQVLHPNVVAALDVVRAGSETLLVMEYVHGTSLGDVLFYVQQTSSIVPVHIATAIVCDVLRGLHAIHEAVSPSGEKLGLVHRDVAPDNIVVGAEGVARVLDFGIAKSSTRPGKTRVGYLKGKAPYVAPERLTDGLVDRRVDVYGAGVVLWEALTGHQLFDGDEAAIFSKVLAGNIAPPSSLTQDLPPELDAIVQRALAFEPRDRFETALEMALALRGFCGDASQVADWLHLVARESLEQRSAVIRQLMLTSAAERTAILATVPPPQRRKVWPLAAALSLCAAAGAVTTRQLQGEPSAQAAVPSRTAAPQVHTTSHALPPAPQPAACVVVPLPEPEPPAKVTPRPAKTRRVLASRAQPAGVIDDGF